jgi:putative flippase GtrA
MSSLCAIAARRPEIVRFGLVGIAATLINMAIATMLLSMGIMPQIANLLAFSLSLLASYAGHYYFTFRSQEPHRYTSPRFGLSTLGLVALSSGLHQALLWSGLKPGSAAVVVALAYAPASFLLNYFWAFARRAITHDDNAPRSGLDTRK